MHANKCNYSIQLYGLRIENVGFEDFYRIHLEGHRSGYQLVPALNPSVDRSARLLGHMSSVGHEGC